MQVYDSEKEVIQNLIDAGCDSETISAFIGEIENGNLESGLRLLAVHRRSLLDELHREQKQIDCLDYLIYQMKKQA